MNEEFEKALLDVIQNEINREVEAEIAAAFFVDMGWTLVTTRISDMQDIGPWMQENIRGNWRGFTDRWIFQDADDAVLFKMRWG